MLIHEGLELLDEEQCLSLLGHVHIGRVAVSLGALPAIFPVNFVLDGTSVVFRTGEGTKLAAAVDGAVIAFEADRFDALERSGWSVMAVGTASVVTDQEERDRMRRLPLAPWVDGRRDNFVRMPLELLSGRRIVHGSDGGDEPWPWQ